MWQPGIGKGHHVPSLCAELCCTVISTAHLLELVALYKTLIQLAHLEQNSLLAGLHWLIMGWTFLLGRNVIPPFARGNDGSGICSSW